MEKSYLTGKPEIAIHMRNPYEILPISTVLLLGYLFMRYRLISYNVYYVEYLTTNTKYI